MSHRGNIKLGYMRSKSRSTKFKYNNQTEFMARKYVKGRMTSHRKLNKIQ
ncbi:hypothetical protein ymoll0001_29810 [Yersinia mollaretii ATCC 43969]|uniref:Integrase n=1 Tax=Yersinia mollaretii (strain ATCC 43969 / DSM 18520 / CIP 103324 / CNY 7263 / WAIP 204) TaxID=349967 RepID=A0ABM9YBT8_YERMW|nr:hypothetical protein ymoll0001_29810 [Yersinia mollaretii ATCC 43969]